MKEKIFKSLIFNNDNFENVYNRGLIKTTNDNYNKKASKFDILIITDLIKNEYKEKLLFFQNIQCDELIKKLEELEYEFLLKLFVLDLQKNAQIRGYIYKNNNNYSRLTKNTLSLFVDLDIQIDEQKITFTNQQEKDNDELIIDNIVF